VHRQETLHRVRDTSERKVERQIAPVRIEFLDQIEFPFASPSLQRALTRPRFEN
jgi:hypothetical protein